ncbi:hypothetical protein TNCV_2034771 [Trichonephila clavipes]|nr:hypothetical protein TNCV_2034771 [Trichonephila clavipes]
MIMRHVKNPLQCPFGLGTLGQIKFQNSISHRQSSGAFLWGGNWASKLLAAVGIAYYIRCSWGISYVCKAAFTPRQLASSIERRTNQRLHLARDEVSDWLDAQHSTLTALV